MVVTAPQVAAGRSVVSTWWRPGKVVVVVVVPVEVEVAVVAVVALLVVVVGNRKAMQHRSRHRRLSTRRGSGLVPAMACSTSA